MAKPPRIDDVEWDTRRPIFGKPARLIIAGIVVALGVLIGSGLAVWVMLPS